MTAEPVIGLRDVLANPQGVFASVQTSGAVYGLTVAEVRHAEKDLVNVWLTLSPWEPMAQRDYPTERVAITTWRTGRIVAVPVDPARRRWEHRNAFRLGSLTYVGDLCLWYPKDPRPLRWEWDDGLIDYLTIVHRHLQAEEYFRRTDTWPGEDAPHGDGDHPILSPALQQIAYRKSA